MSTKPYQTYEDAVIAFNEADARLKQARKDFLAYMRKAGTALRKQVMPGNPDISYIKTHKHKHRQAGVQQVQEQLQMEVLMAADPAGTLTDKAIDDVRNYLRDAGWKIVDDFEGAFSARRSHYFVCI